MTPDKTDVVIRFHVTISLWDAVKARIAGIKPQIEEVRRILVNAIADGPKESP